MPDNLEAATGLDLTRSRSPSEIPTDSALEAERRATEEAALASTKEQAKLGTWHLLGDVGTNTLTGTLLNNTTDYLKSYDLLEVDPSFTKDKFDMRYKEMQKSIPAEYWDKFDEARNEPHFDWIYGQVQERLKVQDELSKAGWGIAATNLGANFFDPISLAVAGPFISTASKIARATEAGLAGRVAINAVGGGLGGLAIEGAKEATGIPTSGSEVMWAVGMGMTFGGVFGELGRNPATKREAAAFVKAGEELKGNVEKPPVEAPTKPVTPPVEAAVEPVTPPVETSVSKPPRALTTAQRIPDHRGDTLSWMMSEREVEKLQKAYPEKTASELTDLRKSIEAERFAAYKTPTAKQDADLDAYFTKGPKTKAYLDAAEKAVEDTLKRILPADMRFIIGKKPGKNWTGLAEGSRKLVTVALRGPDPVQVAYHEAVHILRHYGLFDEAEWRALEKVAKTYWKEYRVAARWEKHYAKSTKGARKQEYLTEEAVAELVGDRGHAEFAQRLHKLPGGTVVQKILAKIETFFKTLHERLRGDPTFEEIFKRIDSGEIAARTPTKVAREFQPTKPAPSPTSVSAAHNPVVTHAFLQDADWRSVQDGDVPRAAGFWRIDRAASSSQSVNAIERLIGPHLLNESVGMVKHALNPMSANLDYRRMHEAWLGEFWKTARPAFEKWAEHKGLTRTQRWTREHEFFEEVGVCIRDREQTGSYHASVQQLASKVAKLQKDILENYQNPLKREGLQGRPIKGSALVPEDEHYLWRKFSPEKIIGAIKEFGQSGVTKMILGAVKSAQPEIADNTAMKIAKGYLMNIHSRAAGLGDEWSIAFAQKDFQRIRAILKDEASLNPDEVEAVVARIHSDRTMSEGDNTNLKRRVLLDELYVERGLARANGETGDLTFHDLLDSNVKNIFEHYSRKASGRIALGRVRIRHKDGTMLQDGITSDADINEIIRTAEQWAADHGQDPQSAATRLRYAFDRILGVPDPAQQTTLAASLRLVRSYEATRLLGQVGIAQLGETGTAMGVLGVRSVFTHVPAFKRIIDAAGDVRNSNPIFEELENIGIGMQRLHGLHYNNLDEASELPFMYADKPRLQRAVNNARLGENVMFEVSAMALIQQRQELWFAANWAGKLARMGTRLQETGRVSRSDRACLAQLNIDGPMLERITAQLRQHADTTEGAFFGQKVSRMNAHKFTDLEARVHLEDALYRMTHKIIQSGDEGSAALLMSNPILQTIFQFRGYGFTAWANQLQWALHTGDWQTAVMFGTSVAWNAAVRAAQIKLIASTRSDKDDYERQHLSAWELGKSGFQRAGWSSLIPMGVDTALGLVGQDGAFNARSTGQSSTALFGSPLVSTIDQAGRAGQMVNTIQSGRSPSQAEMRSLVGLLPFSNLLPVAVGLSWGIKDLPEKSPKVRRHKGY